MLREWEWLSIYMFHRIIFLLLIVSSLSCNFNHCAIYLHRLQEYSKCPAYQMLFKITHRYKTIKQKINKTNSLLCWSVTLLMFIQTLDSSHSNLALVKSENRLAVSVILEIFLTDALNAHVCFNCPEYWMNAICIAKLWNTVYV